MTLRGVLFDLDGTLGDHDASVAAALAAWLPALGVPFDAAVHALWDEVAERHLAAWRAREIDFAEQRRRRLRDFLPAVGRPVDGDLDLVFAGYVDAYQAAYRAYDDALDALAAVRSAGLDVAVLTNGSTAQQRAKLAAMGMAGIGPVFTPEDLGVAKPDPAAFRLACRRWGIAPGKVLSVGDRHEFDVRAARIAGLRAVHLDRPGTGPHGEPDRIRSLCDLPGHL